MCAAFMRYALASAMLMLGLGLTGAEAFVAAPSRIDTAVGWAVQPAAMCGRSCDFGGRYIPGPPSVCYERGLNFCGASRRFMEGPRGFDGGFRGEREDRGGCRTVTIERDDGTVRRIRRCD
jgi:hypothetical protein